MSSKYFAPGAERAHKVEDLFRKIAPRYDLINDLQSLGLHRYWKRRMIQLAAPKPGEHALDVCCGTGDIAFSLAAKGAHVTGFDFSSAMLDVARHRQGTQRKTNSLSHLVDFVQGDALSLPFEKGTFDLVTISYGLRNLANFEAGLTELLRVLKPGGRLLILDFGKPQNPAWRWIYFQHLKWVCPIFGKLFCGDADTHGYILDSLKAYPAQYGVDARLREMGCRDVRLVNLLGGMMSLNIGFTASPIGS